MRRASQRAQMMPQHVQHELGTQEQGPKTVRERELAGNHYVGRCRQTDRFSFDLDRFCVPAIEERGTKWLPRVHSAQTTPWRLG